MTAGYLGPKALGEEHPVAEGRLNHIGIPEMS